MENKESEAKGDTERTKIVLNYSIHSKDLPAAMWSRTRVQPARCRRHVMHDGRRGGAHLWHQPAKVGNMHVIGSRLRRGERGHGG